MDHSYFSMDLTLFIILFGSLAGQEASAHSQALGVSPEESYKAGAGTLCHYSPSMGRTFKAQVR